MKKLHELTLGVAMTLFALTACNNEAILPNAPQVNEPDTPNACVLLGDDFRWEGNESRTALNVEDNVAKFSWTPGDLVGILPDAGAQVYFTIPQPKEGEEVTNKASFDGGAWALRAESNYAAYYPFVEDFHLDRSKVPVNYGDQKQTGITTTHLGAYDYQGARPVTTNANGGGVTFDFDHVGALVLLKFAVPEANTALKSITLSAEGVNFITEGTYDLTSTKENGFPITATEFSTTMIVGVNYTTEIKDEEVTVYFMCAPVDLSGKTVNVSVAYGEGDATLELVAAGKNLEAAAGYALIATATMGDVTDPAQTKKGDFAMKDGSFISYKEDIALTDEQKANVAGIVFWTESEDDGPSTLVGEAVADQVMQFDFPNCTHGLIVSLTDVSSSYSWQSPCESIYDKFQNTELFNPGNKANYVAIESGYDETDNINKILGYNNTKVLEAYNTYCKANNRSNYLVEPIEALAEWKKINPDITGTTGWFLPSAKELHMLCYKDVADVWDENGTYKLDTMTAVNSSFGKVGVTQFGNNHPYWSSSEYADSEDAFYVSLNKVGIHSKNISLHVRAVCAY